MVRRKKTRTEKKELKKAKALHKKDSLLNPTSFLVRRVDLGSEIVQRVMERPPRWGTFRFILEGDKNRLIIN